MEGGIAHALMAALKPSSIVLRIAQYSARTGHPGPSGGVVGGRCKLLVGDDGEKLRAPLERKIPGMHIIEEEHSTTIQ